MAIVSAVAAGSLVQTAQNSFDASSNSNMAVYWGQGPSQPRLAHFCQDTNIDIIPIAFLNVFPDQVNGGYPGTNFGNQCGSETFKNKDGSSSPLLSNCPFIGPDIKTCQALGKKILLSLGGAIPTNQSIKNDESAVAFAKFVWNAFGPVDVTYDGPRPFGDAVVDGFDFDIESAISDNDATSQYRGYGKMIDTLRIFFAADAQKQYYISGSPQCVIPDAHLAHPIQTSWFDFLFIQFYNTPHCSARAYFDATYGAQGNQPSTISFDAWVGFIRTTAMNKDVKLYIGLPAAPLTQLAYDTKMYIAPDDVVNLVELFQCRYPQEFGGIMVFEATYSEQNLIEGKPYVDVIKSQLTKCDCAKKPVTSSVTSSTTTSGHVIPNVILYHQGFRFRILAIVCRDWCLEFDKLHGSCGYWIFVNPSILKQHRHLEHDTLLCPHWNWVFINPSILKQHRHLEHDTLHCPRRNWVLINPSILKQHRHLEHDTLHWPNWNWVLINPSVPNKHWYLEFDSHPGAYKSSIKRHWLHQLSCSGTAIIHGSTSVYTTSTVSTVHTTITSIIPVSPIPSSGPSPTGHEQQPPSVPVPVHGGSSNPASPSSGSGNSPVNSGPHPAPQPEQPAHGGSSSSGNGNSPISNPVPQPEQPAGGSSSSGNGNSPISYPAPQSEQPAHSGSSSSSGSGNSPISHPAAQPEQPAHEGSSSLAHGGSSSTSSGNGNSPSQPQQPAAPAHGPSSSNGNSPIQAGNNSPKGPAAPGLSTTLQTSTKAIAATLHPAGSSSSAPAAPATSQTTTSLPAVITQTLVPIPVSPEQTAHPAKPGASSTGSLSPVQASPVPSPVGSGIGSAAPFPAGNGTAPSGPSGSASAGPSASAPGFPGTSVAPFTGGAGKIGSSVFAMAVVMAVAALI
ncbi:MAG: hypothetical protein Q9179_005971 [Wetmoreana sp. 5 TL-2023]